VSGSAIVLGGNNSTNGTNTISFFARTQASVVANTVVPLSNADMVIKEGGNVGIGTTNPDAKLYVSGSVKIVDGTQGAGKVLTSDANGLGTWASAGSSIPQTNTIYVDSVNGVNAATGRGDINTPYLTIEYALSNITNTGTVTATTTSGSATLTAVSDTTNIQVGQYITGTGIPYESIVVSKTSNTIVLSKTCTASATITATWWTIYDVICIGNFTVTSNIYKHGFYINAKIYNATINFGAFTLFQLTSNAVIPVMFKLGTTNGTSASSCLHTTGLFTAIGCYIDHGYYYSLGTSLQYSNSNGHFNYSGNVTIVGDMFDCRFGSISFFYSIGGQFKWDSDAYGLLGGLRGGGSFSLINGNIITPTSINALQSIGSTFLVYGKITGSVSVGVSTFEVSSIYSDIRGTTITLDGSNVGRINMFGSISGNVSCVGIVGLYGYVSGNVTASGATITCVTIFNGSNGTITVTSGTVIYDYSAPSYNSYFNTVSIGDGTFINNGFIRCSLSYTSTGKFINNGTVYTNISTAVTPNLVINNGGSFINNPNGVVRYDGTEVAALMTKTSGTLINNGRMVNSSRLFVNYSANTSASRDIIIQNSFTNGNGANGGVSKGTGNILWVNTTLANTNTSVTFFDGTNTVPISVVGAGKTVAQINAEIVTLVKASILQFECCEILYGGYVFFIGLQSITTTATSLTNMTSGTYNGGGGLSFTPNALVYGTEINDYNLNY